MDTSNSSIYGKAYEYACILAIIEKVSNIREVEIIENIKEYGYYSFSSIVLNGDTLGCVIILSTETPLIQVEEKMAEILSKLISGSVSV